MVSGLACEAIARGIPITIEPQMSDGFSNYPIFAESIGRLAEAKSWAGFKVREVRDGEIGRLVAQRFPS